MEAIKTMQDARKNILPAALREKNKNICCMIESCLNQDPNLRPTLSCILNQMGTISHLSRSSASTDIERTETLGNLLVVMEDADNGKPEERFLSISQGQLLIFKSVTHQKATMIYSLDQCNVDLVDNSI
jgi:hypothetical protein